MIDTVKIYAEIDKNLYNQIYNKSVIKSSIDNDTGELIYEIVNDHLDGSYDSRLSVRIGFGLKYHFAELEYYIELEGSYHKITKGYNSHDGIYNLNYIVKGFIELVENSYKIKLPDIEKWFLYRLDLAKCFDLGNQNNVIKYLKSLVQCRYPRRNVTSYNGGINCPGTVTTLKIYNKYLEFKKHDLKKFKDKDFKLQNYLEHIQGFVRFEVEIKKKKLLDMYGKNLKHIKVKDLEYKDFEKVWCDEFMKLLGIIEKDLDIVRGKEEVKKRLLTLYGNAKGMRLFNFYCSIQLNGIDFVRSDMSKTTYYRQISELKDARIDYSQTYQIEECSLFYFNPFEFEEVI